MRNKSALLSVFILTVVLLMKGIGTARAQETAKDELPPTVYVIGYVLKPQAIAFKPGIPVRQVVAMAGGVRRDGGIKRIRIRKPIAEDKIRRIMIVDLKAIAK